jgi:hypothetical protein
LTVSRFRWEPGNSGQFPIIGGEYATTAIERDARPLAFRGYYDANRGVGVLSPTADSATWWSPVDVKNAGLNVWELAPLDHQSGGG